MVMRNAASRAVLPGALDLLASGLLACGLLGLAPAGAALAAGPAEHDHGAATEDTPPGPVAEPNKPDPATAPSGRMTGRKDAYLYIGWPNNGEVVSGHFKVWFGLRNFGVAPAGVRKENTGHHHLLIDADPPPMDEPIPNNPHHVHFGKGQTETYLDLPPGRHTLQLLLGDADHIPHDPPIMSKKITITVVGDRGRSPHVAQR